MPDPDSRSGTRVGVLGGSHAAAATIAVREAELHALFGTALVGIVHSDARGRVLDANDAFLAITGRTREGLEAGRVRWDELTPPECLWFDEAAFAEAMADPAGRCRPYEKEYVRPDGTRVPVLLSFKLLDRATGECACFVVDLTEARRRDARLRESEARLRHEAERRMLLLEASGAILGDGADEAALAELVFRKVSAHLGAELGFNYALDADGRTLRLVAGFGIPPEMAGAAQSLQLGQAFCGTVAATGQPLSADASRIASDDLGALVRAMGVRAYACHPLLRSDGRLLGTLSFARTHRDRFDADEIEFLQTLSHFVALAWQRRRDMAALAEGEARWHGLFGHLHEGVVLGEMILSPEGKGVDFRFLDVNAAFERQTGLKAAAVAGRLVTEAIPGIEPVWIETYARVVATGEPASVVYFTASLGRWFEARAYRTEPGRFATLFLDVTASKVAEATLRESEARLRLAQRIGRTGSFDWDVTSNRATYSEEYVALHGLPPGTTTEDFESWRARLHPEDRERTVAEVSNLGPDARPSLEYRILRADDGTMRWISERRETFHDAEGRPVRVIGSQQDVTEQREAEAALRQSKAHLARSEARFRAAVQAVSGIMWTNSAEGRMEGEQPGWARLTGQSQAEYQEFGWAGAVHPEDAQPTIDAWNAAVAARQTFVFEHRVRRHDGAWRRFAIRAIPVLGGEGAVEEWVGVHTDITEQHEARTVLARDRDELERLVAERTQDLQETQQRLAHAQRMEALGQLAGGIAHDFNNVLQAVQGGVALIEKRAGRDDIFRLANMVKEAAGRGSAVTRRLLAFSRRGELRAEPVEPAALLEGMQEILGHTLGGGVEVRVEARPDLPRLLADKGQLETVLVNLATNARDAMPGGGVLTFSARLDEVGWGKEEGGAARRAGLRPGHYLRLALADTGEGMAPEVLARASEPFFTTKGHGQGTGLGLAMAKGFAEQSGGAMSIESAPGRGTAVSLWFPLSTQAPASVPTEEDAGAARPGNACILLVDDDTLVREVLAEQMQAEGYDVRVAASATEALALLDAGEAVDLLVSDLSMPGMDGVATIREAQQRRPGLPAILLTGFATSAAELAAGGLPGGAFTLLRKPATAEQLAERIAVSLEGAVSVRKRGAKPA